MEVPAAGPPAQITLAATPRSAAPPPPSVFARAIAAPFWAGLLCAGVGLWMLGLLISLDRAGVVHGSGADHLVIPLALIAVSVGFVVGYRAPIRSYASLFGRLVGELLWAGASAAVLVAIVQSTVGDHGDGPASKLCVVMGAAVTALVVARLHRVPLLAAVREPGRGRRFAIGGAALLVLGTTWSMSASFRCWLGSGAACRAAAEALDDGTLGLERARLLERGCDDADAPSCALAAAAYRRGKEVPRDLDRARELFVAACALGDTSACHDVDLLSLEKRCDGYSATACRALADDVARRDPSAAVRLFQKACLLGDDEACRRR